MPKRKGTSPATDEEFIGFTAPTYTMVPDELFDRLLPTLSGAELKVLLYICRRTFGFKKSADAISIRQMARGITTDDGTVLDRGTGLSIPGITKAIKSLVAKSIITATRRSSPKKGDEATTYALNVIEHPLLKELRGGPPQSLDGGLNSVKTQDTVVQETVRQEQQHQDAAVRGEHAAQQASNARVRTTVVGFSDLGVSGQDHRLRERLAGLGIAESRISKILNDHSREEVYRWVSYTEHRLQSGWVPKDSPAAWLVAALRSGDWVIPEWFRTPQEQAEAATARDRQEQHEAQRLVQEQEEQARRDAEQRRAIEAELGVGERTRDLWDRTRALLQEWGQMSAALLSAYLLPLRGGKATVATPVEFFCRVIEADAPVIREAIAKAAGRPIEWVEVQHVEMPSLTGE